MILSAQNIAFSVHGRDLFRNVSFELDANELGLLTGPSGSGKTALGLAACGFARFIGPDASVTGSLLLFGEPVIQGEYHPGAGLVLENPYVQISGMKRTAGGELAFPLECRGVPAAEIHDRVGRMLGILGITHLENHPLQTLSGGELKRVVIGAGLMTSPRFLFLDRPFAEIDTAFRHELFSLFEEHSSRHGGAALIAEDPWLLPARRFRKEIRLGKEKEYEHADACEPIPQKSCPGDRGRDPVLRVESLSFAYPGAAPLLNDIDLELYPGEVLFLEGPNGAGKTTLAKLIAGILAPNSGKVLIDGKDTAKMSRSGQMNLAGFAPQNPMIVFCRRTVREELDLGRTWGNDPGPVLPVLGLDAMLDRHPLELTRAEQKRLVIALACGPERRIIMLDEPSQYHDRESFRQVVDAVCAIAGEGKAVIVISHDPRFREAFPDAPVFRLGRSVLSSGCNSISL